jgi:hypothetical protein
VEAIDPSPIKAAATRTASFFMSVLLARLHSQAVKFNSIE